MKKIIFFISLFCINFNVFAQTSKYDSLKVVRLMKETEIPEWVFMCKNLEKLEVNGLFIKKLPKKLRDMPKLKAITIFRDMPTENFTDRFQGDFYTKRDSLFKAREKYIYKIKIPKLKNIKELNLDNLGLTKSLSWIKKFSRLEDINLTNNKLTNIPKHLKRKHLKALYFNENIPIFNKRSFRGLDSLQTLQLIKNNLYEVPKGIGKLVKLKKLRFSGNKLSNLPQELENLKDLEDLGLYENNFEQVPEFVYNFKKLQELDLYYNKIKKISDKISNLKNLEYLYLSYNQLTEIPKTIIEIDSLKELYVHHNRLVEIPDLSPIKGLKVLHIQKNSIALFPEWIKKLTELTELDLSTNAISDLPPVEILELKKLKKFMFNENMLEESQLNSPQIQNLIEEFEKRGVNVVF